MAPRFPLIAVGGMAGALLRWGIIDLLSSHRPIAILVLNIAGSLTIGVLAGKRPNNVKLWSLIGIGFCGGMTTFSSFALEVAQRLDSGNISGAIGYHTATVLLAIVASGVGFRLGSDWSGEQQR